MSDRLEQIEFRMAYLEQANAQLSDTVYQQQLELKALRAELATLLQRMEAAQTQSTAWTPQDEKPPHY
jgi:uncharacterized coiled-coil protein SlyX